MIVFYIVWIILLTVYICLILWIRDAWVTYPISEQIHEPLPSVSVVVAVRNEEENIGALLSSLQQVDYPADLLEVIIVDDHSDDNTVSIMDAGLSGSRSKYLQLSDSTGKKAALHFGIQESTADIILCTDGDCIIPPLWIKEMMTPFLQSASIHLVTGLIRLTHHNSLLGAFQAIDNAGTMASTLAGIQSGHFLTANGANLAFRKSTYNEVAGHQSAALASGDDVFLIQKVAEKYPGGVAFVKSRSAIVHTPAAKTYTSFFDQRKRWATKSKYYPQKGLLRIQGFIWVFHFFLVSTIGVAIIGSSTVLWMAVAIMITGKAMVDYFLLRRVTGYLNEVKAMRSFLWVELLYIPYILYMGIVALFPSRYMWKGRKVH